MVVYSLASQLPDCHGHAVGASLGQAHLRSLGEALSSRAILPGIGLTIILDYGGIHTATASYLKSTLLWLHLCGQLTQTAPAGAFPLAGSAGGPTACELFPLAARVSEEVSEELGEVFGGRALPCLVALHWTLADGVRSARLLGRMEPTVRRTLDLLLAAGHATAADLHRLHDASEGINLTAWNNRLTELFRLRLCRRLKQGKHWVYQPLAQEVIYG